MQRLENADLWGTKCLVLYGKAEKFLPLRCCTNNQTAFLKVRREGRCISNAGELQPVLLNVDRVEGNCLLAQFSMKVTPVSVMDWLPEEV